MTARKPAPEPVVFEMGGTDEIELDDDRRCGEDPPPQPTAVLRSAALPPECVSTGGSDRPIELRVSADRLRPNTTARTRIG